MPRLLSELRLAWSGRALQLWLLRAFDVHADDAAVAEAVDVMHDPVRDDRAGEVADDLVHLDGDATVGLVAEADGPDVGVDQAELSRPVRAHCLRPPLAPAVHPVRPVDVRMHQLERRVDVARVEGVVRSAKQLFLLRQRPRSATLTSALPRFSPLSIPMNAAGAFSRPSVTSSRHLSLPSATHRARRIAASS